MKEIGRPMDDCGRETPLALFAKTLGAPGPPPPWTGSAVASGRALPTEWIVAHLNELTESDFDLVRRSKSNFQIIHCPRSHTYFTHSPFQFERLHALDFNICLGTDSLASNEDLSLFAEMRQFQKMFPDVSPEQILSMVTVSPAKALQRANSLGKIRSGFYADLIAIPISSSAKAVYEQIIAFEGAVKFSMVGGRK
jgi:cytosine/adenosine deaminase-related metal-dependent hydrolase